MGISFNMQAVVWLAAIVILLAAEAMTLGLATIWFAGGALAAFFCALFGMDLMVQLIVFCVVSVLLLVVTRPLAVRWVNKDRIKTNAESLIGQTAVVTEPIDNLENKGQVQVNGQYWSARSLRDGAKIAQSKVVKIRKISGVKLIVEEE